MTGSYDADMYHELRDINRCLKSICDILQAIQETLKAMEAKNMSITHIHNHYGEKENICPTAYAGIVG